MIEVPLALAKRRDLSATAKLIFSWLVPLVSKGIHPGYRTIALESGIDKNTARKALADLERHGLLRIERTGAGRGCRYVVTWSPEDATGRSASPAAETTPPRERAGFSVLVRIVRDEVRS